jgi:hypothetical protein
MINSAVYFAPGNTERMRIDPSGNVLVGTTTTTGSASNTTSLIAGLFTTVNNETASTASGTAVTLFTLPSEGTFMVTAFIFATSAPAAYNAVSMAISSGATARVVSIATATNMTITLSGLNVQATQTSGANQIIIYRALRVG